MNGSIYDFHAKPLETLFDGPRLRRELLSFANGKVLEVGAGTGFNFEYYRAGLEVTAIEPDNSMRKRALQRASRNSSISVASAEAEALPFANESFDTVVCTMALCSVDDPEKAVSEAYRVLKPGGRFLLMEHIRKNTPISGKVLDLMNPGWKRIVGGCNLNRKPAEVFAKSKFTIEKHEPLWKGFGGFWVLRK